MLMRLMMISILLFLPLLAWGADGNEAAPGRLHVQGHAELRVPADQVQVRVGVTNEAEDVDKALEANNSAMLQVKKELLSAGLQEHEYSTSRFQLRPRWSTRPRNATGSWRPEIVGYSVQNSLDIKTTRIESLGKLIAAARKGGANDIGDIRFSLSEPRKYRRQAIAQAVEYARADAANASQSAGRKLGDILRITIGPREPSPVTPLAEAAMPRAMAADTVPPIFSPGDLRVTATVSLEFALARPGASK